MRRATRLNWGHLSLPPTDQSSVSQARASPRNRGPHSRSKSGPRQGLHNHVPHPLKHGRSGPFPFFPLAHPPTYSDERSKLRSATSLRTGAASTSASPAPNLSSSFSAPARRLSTPTSCDASLTLSRLVGGSTSSHPNRTSSTPAMGNRRRSLASDHSFRPTRRRLERLSA